MKKKRSWLLFIRPREQEAGASDTGSESKNSCNAYSKWKQLWLSEIEMRLFAKKIEDPYVDCLSEISERRKFSSVESALRRHNVVIRQSEIPFERRTSGKYLWLLKKNWSITQNKLKRTPWVAHEIIQVVSSWNSARWNKFKQYSKRKAVFKDNTRKKHLPVSEHKFWSIAIKNWKTNKKHSSGIPEASWSGVAELIHVWTNSITTRKENKLYKKCKLRIFRVSDAS